MPSPQSLLSNKVKLYAQKKDIDWEVDHLPPRTRIYLFINGTPYDQYAAPVGGTLGDPIFSDEFGSARGQLSIPRNAEEKILLGEIRITFADNPTDLTRTTFTAESTFYAMDDQELFNLDQGGTRTTRQPIPFSRTAGSALKEVDTAGNNINAISERLELVAQTFNVDASIHPQGIFVSSVDLFFASKDASLPISVELRNTINGIPVSNEYFNGSYVRKFPDDIPLPNDDIIQALALPSIVAATAGSAGTSATSLSSSVVTFLDSLKVAPIGSPTASGTGFPLAAYRYSVVNGRLTFTNIDRTPVNFSLANALLTLWPGLDDVMLERKNPIETYTLTAEADGSYVDPRNGSRYTGTFSAGSNFMVRNGILYKFPDPPFNTITITGRDLTGDDDADQIELELTEFGNSLLNEAGVSRYASTSATITETIFGTRSSTGSGTPVYNKTDRRWGTFMNANAVWENNVYARNFSRSYQVDFPETQDYKFEYAIDNAVDLYIDGDKILNNAGSNFGSSTPVTRTVTAGTHTIAWDARNSGDVGGFGLKITREVTSIGTVVPTAGGGILGGAGNFPATNFKFRHPIYLQPGTYAICIRTNSDQYNLATARADLPLAAGSENRKPESLSGSLFRASNIGQRIPDTNEDLCYVLYRYKFDTGIRSLFLDNFAPDTPFRYDAFKLRSTTLEFPELAEMTPKVSHTDEAGIASLFDNTTIDTPTPLNQRRLISQSGDSALELIFQTQSPDISPVLDKEKLVGVMYRNEIDPYEIDTSEEELTPEGGIARARYVSKIVTLIPGFESNGMEVRLDVNRKIGTDIEVFVKVLAPSDGEPFNKRPWKKMTLVSNEGNKKYAGFSETSFFAEYYQLLSPDLEYEATSIEGIPGLFKEFNRYMIKVVFYSNNPTFVPKIRNLFASACIDVPSQVISALGPQLGSLSGFNLQDLSNIGNTPPTAGQVLVWDGNQWVPGNVGSSTKLGDLVDTDTGVTDTPAGLTNNYLLSWQAGDQKWKAVDPAAASAAGDTDARQLSQIISFGRSGDTPFEPYRFTPAGPFMDMFPYLESSIPNVALDYASATDAEIFMSYDAGTGLLIGRKPVTSIIEFGRNFVATRYTDAAALYAARHQDEATGIEILSSIQSGYGNIGSFVSAPFAPAFTSGNPYALLDLINLRLAIRSKVNYISGGNTETRGGFFVTPRELIMSNPAHDNRAQITNLSASDMKVKVHLRFWANSGQTIRHAVVHYVRGVSGAGRDGYTNNQGATYLIDGNIGQQYGYGTEVYVSQDFVIGPKSITDVRFAVAGDANANRMIGGDDFIYLIDFYVTFEGWQ